MSSDSISTALGNEIRDKDEPKEITTSHLLQSHPLSEAFSRNDRTRLKRHKVVRDRGKVNKQRQKLASVAYELVKSIFEDKSLKYSFDAYYRVIRSLCMMGSLEQSALAEYLSINIHRYFFEFVKPKIGEIIFSSSDDLCSVFSEYLSVYSNYLSKLQVLSKLFVYLDKGYLLPHKSKRTILEDGLVLFVDELLVEKSQDTTATINDTARETLSKHRLLLNQMRLGSSTHVIQVAKSLTSTLLSLNFNRNIHIHMAVINLAVHYYGAASEAFLANAETFLQTVFSFISKEISFFADCGYDKQFLRDLQKKLKWTLIFQDFTSVMNTCMPIIIEAKDKKMLSLLYDLSEDCVSDHQFDAPAVLLFHWEELAIHLFTKFTKDGPDFLITRLFDAYSELESLSKNVKNSELFEYELRRALNKVLNDKQTNIKVISQLSRYCDSFFKNNLKKLSKSETTTMSFNDFAKFVSIIFRALNNKNDFLHTYKKDLSKRLLLGRSSRLVYEMRLTDKFSEVVGEVDEIVGIRMMFKDLAISKENYSSPDLDVPYNFSALVLQQKYWPDVPKHETNISLPPEFNSVLDAFTVKYHNSSDKKSEHILDWTHYSLHQLSISTLFHLGLKELNINMLQAAVLWLFNDNNEYTYDEILKNTNMGGKTLKRVLASLTSAKHRILLKQDNKYSFNFYFDDPSTKIRIALPRDKEALENLVSLDETLERNRNTEFRCIIVGVIKKAKSLSFSELLEESITLARKKGPCDINDIKRNIDYLVENEYLRRDSDPNFFTYIP